MTNNELMIVLRKTLLGFFKERGYDWPVEQNYQPSQTGTNRKTTVYFHHVNDVVRGYPHSTDVWDEDSQIMTTVETQLIETRIQIAATVDAPYCNPTALTVIDVLRLSRFALQSQYMTARLAAEGANVYRVSDVQSVDVLSDSPGYEKRPTFDIIVQHQNVLKTTVGSTDTVLPGDKSANGGGGSNPGEGAAKRGIFRI